MVFLTLMQVVLTVQAILRHKVNILHWLYFEYQVWTSLNASTTVECIDILMHWCVTIATHRSAGQADIMSLLPCAREVTTCCINIVAAVPWSIQTDTKRKHRERITQRSLIGKKWQGFLTLGLKFNEQTIHKASVMIWMCPHEHLTVSDIYCQNAGKKYSFDRKYRVEYQEACWWWAEVVLADPADAGHRWSTSSSLTSCRSTTQNLPPNLQTKLQGQL
jgi:hypothetical protein